MGIPESPVEASPVERQLAALIDQTTASMAMFDRGMNYLAASDRWLAFVGTDRRSAIGRSHYDVFPAVPERWKAGHRRALAGEALRC